MHPVLRRVLLHAMLTAGVLALLGVLFAELASVWLNGNATRGGADVNQQVSVTLRTSVPLTMAFWGFVFVLVCELVIWRVRGSQPVAKPAEPQPDDAEKLLNELLAQAEAKMAAEAGLGRGETGDGIEQKHEVTGEKKPKALKPSEPPT